MSGVLRRAIVGVISAMTLTGALAVGASAAISHPAPAAGSSLHLAPLAPAAPSAASVAPVAPTATTATISFRSAMPTVVSSETAVTITGTLTASDSTPLPAGQVRVIRGASVLTARTEVDGWAVDTTPATGTVLGRVRTPVLSAGASAPFELTLAAGVVRSGQAFEAIPISLELFTAGATPEAVTHSFLAWNSRKEYEPLSVATLVPVTLAPDLELFSRDQATKDRAWQRAIGVGSRIQSIVEGTRDTAVTLVVDPAVLGPEAGGEPVGPTPPTTSPPPIPSVPVTPPAPLAPATTSVLGAPGNTGPPSGTDPTPGSTTATTDPSAAGTAGPASPTPTPTSTPDPDSTGSPGPGAPSVTSILADALARQLRGHSVWALPYADADVAAAAEIDPTNPLIRDLVSRASTLTARLDQPARSDVAWPADEVLPAGREAELNQVYTANGTDGTAGIIVRQDAITTASPYTPDARRVATGGTPLLGVDPGLSAELPTTANAAGLSIQRYLADTLVLLGERPGTPRTVLVAATRTWDPDVSALTRFLEATDVPWLARIDASTLLGPASSVRLAEQAPIAPLSQIAPAATLNATRLAHLTSQHETILRVATVLRDGAGFEKTYREVLDELTSVRWRYAPSQWTTLSQAVSTEVQAATSAIKVIPRDVNFLAESGILQITIANGLDYEINDIRLVLAPTNPRMQIVEQPGPITIGADSRTTVRVPVTAVAAGQADIRAMLTTADGTPIGQAATIPVSANPLDAQIYWVGGIVVGLILIAGVLRTVLRGTSRMEEIGGDPAHLVPPSGPPAGPPGGGRPGAGS